MTLYIINKSLVDMFLILFLNNNLQEKKMKHISYVDVIYRHLHAITGPIAVGMD